MQIWCIGCNQWYESEEKTSECPFCYTFNYKDLEDKDNGE